MGPTKLFSTKSFFPCKKIASEIEANEGNRHSLHFNRAIHNFTGAFRCRVDSWKGFRSNSSAIFV